MEIEAADGMGVFISTCRKFSDPEPCSPQEDRDHRI
jgi:hypothetical protein